MEEGQCIIVAAVQVPPLIILEIFPEGIVVLPFVQSLCVAMEVR